MTAPIRVVLFSEVNSRLGGPFLAILAEHPLVELVAVVTSPPGVVSPYFLGEEEQVDLERAGADRAIPVLRPTRVSAPELTTAVAALQPDYLIIGNYQQILRPDLLAVPRELPVNFHPSPLPRYAGWAPFFWMVRDGERNSAVTAIAMTAEIDAGPIIAQHAIRLSGEETALEVRESHTIANVALLRELIPRFAARDLAPTAQNLRDRTYYGKPAELDYLLDFGQDTETLIRTVRAGYRRPGAFALTEQGERIVVLTMERHRRPLDADTAAGTVLREGAAILVAANDGWLRLWSVEIDGDERLAELPSSCTAMQTGRLAMAGG